MHTVLHTLLFLCLALTARSQEPTPDHKAFQGNWNALEAIHDGKPTSKEELKGTVVTFTGDQMEITFQGKSKKGTFKLDPTKRPKAIDLVMGKDRSIGIYALEGDKLKLCLVPQKKDKDGKLLERPTTFESTRENRQELVILQRVK